MNAASNKNLENLIENSKSTELKPLQMNAKDENDKVYDSIAYNEVSLMRQSHQASKFEIKINDTVRMSELICDGVLVSTSAGSTAYNLSAHGSILPLDSKLLALTPISAFKPRKWKGQIISQKNIIKFKNLKINRPISIVADNFEIRNVDTVSAKINKKIKIKLLFNENQDYKKKLKKLISSN